MCDDGEPTDQVTCERVLAIMSDEGSVAIQEWLGSDRETGPFESTSYVDTLYAPGEQAKVVSGQFFVHTILFDNTKSFLKDKT